MFPGAYQMQEWLERAMTSLRTVEPFCMKLVGWLCPYKPLQRQGVYTPRWLYHSHSGSSWIWLLVHLLNYFFHLIHAIEFKAFCREHSPKEFFKIHSDRLCLWWVLGIAYISREHQQRLRTLHATSPPPPLVFSCPCSLLNGCFLLYHFTAHFYYILSCFLGDLCKL